MGTLGKILLFVNLLAAAGLTYLAVQDWAARQEVAAVALRHELVLRGLPVEPPKGEDIDADGQDSVVLGAETSNLHRVETVRPSLLQSHFQGADGGQQLGGGEAPANQIAEVKRVQGKVDGLLAAANGPVEKLALLCGRFTPQGGYLPGWLTLLAESYDERDLVRSMVLPQALADAQAVQQNVEQAEAMLKKRFEAVLATPNPQLANQEAEKLKEVTTNLRQAGEQMRQAGLRYQQEYNRVKAAGGQEDAAFQAATRDLQAARTALTQASDALKAHLRDIGSAATRDEGDRRRRIAHLLTHLDREAAWQKRVALVVGLRTYLEAIQDQVNRLRDMAISAEQQIALDQAEFSEKYEVLKSLANERAALLSRQTGLTADLADQRVRDREAVNQRTAQLARRQQDLANLQAEVAKALQQQATAEQALFAVQKQVGQAMDRNFELEQQLAEAEKKKAGGK